MSRGKIGLALGGGAARGWAHIGVIKALNEAGIRPDIIVGTSIGAVVGGCHAAGRLDEIENFSRRLTRRRVIGFLDFSLLGSGLITGQKLTRELLTALGEASIEDLKTRFAAIATELGTGHEVWLTKGRLVDAIAASYALPGIFKPVNLGGRWLFDGALVNPIPVSVCRALGARYVIAVNLNADVGGRGTAAPFEPARPVPAAEPDAKAGKDALQAEPAKRASEKPSETAPGIASVMIEAFNIVQDRIARSRLAGDPPDAIISPRLAGIGPFEFHRADELISRGAAAAQRVIEDIARELETRRQLDQRMVAVA